MFTPLKKFSWRPILTIAALFLVLSWGTACNRGDVRGARPNNPPVQMGGANNPYKGSGDGLTQYRQSPDPNLKQGQALLRAPAIAVVPNVEQENPGLLYEGDTESTNPRDLPLIRADKLPATPEPRQPVIDRSNPDEGILEKTTEAFKKASEFIQGAGEQVSPNSNR
ncbi:MAG: hypothetical protein HC890_16005 [Chloroflexaceae bacterium]|nr:hypothetical protein [Chloroflexaceae bacterium]